MESLRLMMLGVLLACATAASFSKQNNPMNCRGLEESGRFDSFCVTNCHHSPPNCPENFCVCGADDGADDGADGGADDGDSTDDGADDGDSTDDRDRVITSGKVYTLAVGANYPPYDFIGEPDLDAENPALPIRGFSNEVALLLCRMAGVKCEHVLDPYDFCWGRHINTRQAATIPGVEGVDWPVYQLQSSDSAGEGILSGWYDACIGWTHTYLRQNSVRFGHAMTKVKAGGILMLNSKITELGGIEAVRESDLSGLSIGIIEGWATNSGSLAYIVNPSCSGENLNAGACTGPFFDASSMTIVGFADPDLGGQGLLDGEVDAMWFYDSMVEDRSGIGSTNPAPWVSPNGYDVFTWVHTDITNYAANGTAMFVKKDNEFADIWDATMPAVLESQEYAALCDEYGFTAECILAE